VSGGRGGHMGWSQPPTPRHATMQVGWRKPIKASPFFPPNHTARVRRREKFLHAKSWELFNQLVPHFHLQTSHFLWFQNPGRNTARFNSSWSKNQCQIHPIPGARITVTILIFWPPNFYTSFLWMLASLEGKEIHKIRTFDSPENSISPTGYFQKQFWHPGKFLQFLLKYSSSRPQTTFK